MPLVVPVRADRFSALDLHADGFLSDDEYARRKNEIIDSMLVSSGDTEGHARALQLIFDFFRTTAMLESAAPFSSLPGRSREAAVAATMTSLLTNRYASCLLFLSFSPPLSACAV